MGLFSRYDLGHIERAKTPLFMGLCAFAVSACAHHRPTEDEWKTRTQVIMATPVTVRLPSPQSLHFDPLFKVFQSVDETLSSYRPDSEIGRLNSLKQGNLGEEAFAGLKKAIEMAQLTQGLFDPTIGALTLKAYGFGGDHPKIPSAHEIEKVRKSVGYRRVLLRPFPNGGGGFARIPGDTLLDLGGIGKGYAIDLAAGYLNLHGVKEGVLAASGDIRCLQACALSIQHPFRRDAELLRFRSKGEMAVSTSGTYERKIGRDAHHLIVPRSGLPSRFFTSVTLAAGSDNATIDALATAVSVTDQAHALKLLRNFPAVEFLLVSADKEVTVSQGFMDLIEDPVWSEDIADFKITTVTANKKN